MQVIFHEGWFAPTDAMKIGNRDLSGKRFRKSEFPQFVPDELRPFLPKRKAALTIVQDAPNAPPDNRVAPGTLEDEKDATPVRREPDTFSELAQVQSAADLILKNARQEAEAILAEARRKAAKPKKANV